VGQFFSAPCFCASKQWVRPRRGNILKLNGEQFRFAGSSNYYLMYKSQFMVDDVLDAAVATTSASCASGFAGYWRPERSIYVAARPADGVYFQYWDPATGAPAYNDGATGLSILTTSFTRLARRDSSWSFPSSTTGMISAGWTNMCAGATSAAGRPDWYHDSFYTDPVIKQCTRTGSPTCLIGSTRTPASLTRMTRLS